MLRASAFVGIFSTAALAASAQTLPAEHGAKIFQRCAACHLPNGQGVPGAFPALAGRLDTAAATEAGREYLVLTVSAGLMGEIDIDGRKIRGVMPAQAGLTDADIAAVLNYAIALKGDVASPAKGAAAAFTAQEVAATRAKHPNTNPNAVHAIRSGAFPPTSGPEK